jgi:bifunctional UDP-N-acetylglucosamine pyrophosphorylase / glucosamine-1-phosphate N-acetyltransferase
MNQSDSSEPPSTGDRLGVVILAAGQGTRMRSRLPKVLHPVAGLPMVRQVVELGRGVDPASIVLVVGHAAEQVIAAAGDGVSVVHQTEQLGTGHAVLQAREALRGRSDLVVILLGDTVLVRPETIRSMVAAARRATLVLLTAVVEDTTGYGRVKRDREGRIVGFVELRDDIPEHEALREIWGGVMVARAEWLWEHVGRLPPGATGEIFLPDLVTVAAAQGLAVDAVRLEDPSEVWGINTQAQLADANRILLERIRRRWLEAGVRMLDPGSVYVESTVELEPDVVVHPNTHLQGATRIGAGTEVGPNSIVRDSIIGRGCRVVASMLEEARVGDAVTIGPFAHLRPGARIEDGVELGNYAEVKASTIGAGTRMHHFSYVGDAEIGRDVNIGAGTITVNYDGKRKHRTVVGDGAFIGSDTLLRAPLVVGEGATTGAGSVVTRDVKPGQLVVGVPARPVPGRSPAPPTAGDASSPAPADEAER